jgi:hypothetical protein
MLRKLKARFNPKSPKLEIDADTLILGLQLGWFERYLGGWLLTERGEKELVAIIEEEKKKHDS